ncbi:hypothetical protein Sru01_52640 [Sphaerisporangium rufum]|uniref:Uncharacterized protein n=1 Tax=Sphaerisporangium rufum TaxID=1381558 RepID=A0A919R5X3_9ACTN|nr:hypothetical protein Sru01_52640 [Sphaerisporangium rufum]
MLEWQVQGLAQVPDAAGRDDGHLAVVRALQAGGQAQQRGLSRAVLADDADPLARPDGEGDLVEDLPVSVGLANAPQGQLGGQGGSPGARRFGW